MGNALRSGALEADEPPPLPFETGPFSRSEALLLQKQWETLSELREAAPQEGQQPTQLRQHRGITFDAFERLLFRGRHGGGLRASLPATFARRLFLTFFASGSSLGPAELGGVEVGL